MTFLDLLHDHPANKDLKINLKKLFFNAEDSPLDAITHQAITLAVSYTLQDQAIIDAAQQHTQDLDQTTQNAVKICATTMAMNNVYYRATHLIHSQSLSQQPAGLRMQGMSMHGIATPLFELMSLAVSAINGCGLCLQSHYKQLQAHYTDEQIAESLRIASVLHTLKQSRTIANS